MANDRVSLYCARCGATQWLGKWWPRGMAYDEPRAIDAVAFMDEHLTWCRDRVFYEKALPLAWCPDLGNGPLWVRPISEGEHWRLTLEAEAMGWIGNALDFRERRTDAVAFIAPAFVVT